MGLVTGVDVGGKDVAVSAIAAFSFTRLTSSVASTFSVFTPQAISRDINPATITYVRCFIFPALSP